MPNSKDSARKAALKSADDVERLEKVIGQLHGAHAEIAALARKSPNDSPNKFKVDLINKILVSANLVLGPSYKPVDGFVEFDFDDAPTSSDVTMMLGQYLEEIERFRSDNVTNDFRGWWYLVNGKMSNIHAGPPRKLARK
jgi:hypothetical protein